MDQEQKLDLIKRLEQKVFLKENLPHLHGHKLYQWQEDFIASKNRMNFLSAGNQLGKSSSGIIKCIRLATEKELWPIYWPNHPTPRQFWYFYPDKATATREFNEKWKKDYLPRGPYKRDPVYGWKANIQEKEIQWIEFDSGVTVYFLSYEQRPKHLQASTVHAVFADEELPLEHFAELNVRLNATEGYYHNIFTATLGQEYLRLTLEPEPYEEEKFPQAFKQVVSAYDCLYYADGTPSTIWTRERIRKVEASLPTQDEIQRRIYGRFVVSSGRKYASFDDKVNVKPSHPLPPSWHYYAGLDWGSGGQENHPSAIVIVGVSPDFTKGRVVRCWRGDGITTTAGDVVDKYRELTAGLDITAAYYDWAASDMGTIASRLGIPLLKANKHHNIGEPLLNTLFKNRQLVIFDTDHEAGKLIVELKNLLITTRKNEAKDDLTDALRYAISSVPWKIETQEEIKRDTAIKKAMPVRRQGRFIIDDPDEDTSFDFLINEAISMFEDDYGSRW